MLRLSIVVLSWLCLARPLPAELQLVRAYSKIQYKELSTVLSGIDERLKQLDKISEAQAQQSRRLEVIQNKLDRVETTLSLRLERAQLAAERLEHRMHMLQTSVQATTKESTEKLETSQTKIAEIATNLTSDINFHRLLLEKASGAYSETWRRSLLLESLMRDGLSLVNVTRRELADGLRSVARRHVRTNAADIEAIVGRSLGDKNVKIDVKVQEVLDAQKRLVDSCQRVQQDYPIQVTDVLDKLMDKIIIQTNRTSQDFQNIKTVLRNHDSKVSKYLRIGSLNQNDATCHRLEEIYRNASHSTLKEKELQQMTEKFIDLTDRADAALQKLEKKLEAENEEALTSDITSEADKLMMSLSRIQSEKDAEDDDSWEDDDINSDYYNGNIDDDDNDEEKFLPSRASHKGTPAPTAAPTKGPRRRHPHKHPYDRGPK